jgi:hypothetical protein
MISMEPGSAGRIAANAVSSPISASAPSAAPAFSPTGIGGTGQEAAAASAQSSPSAATASSGGFTLLSGGVAFTAQTLGQDATPPASTRQASASYDRAAGLTGSGAAKRGASLSFYG